MEGIIYKTPVLLDVLRSRAQKCSLYLKRSFESLLGDVEFTPSAGHKCFKVAKDEVAGGKKTFVKPTVQEFPSFSSVVDDIAMITSSAQKKT